MVGVVVWFERSVIPTIGFVTWHWISCCWQEVCKGNEMESDLLVCYHDDWSLQNKASKIPPWSECGDSLDLYKTKTILQNAIRSFAPNIFTNTIYVKYVLTT